MYIKPIMHKYHKDGTVVSSLLRGRIGIAGLTGGRGGHKARLTSGRGGHKKIPSPRLGRGGDECVRSGNAYLAMWNFEAT